ncbi:MAG: hypothetical protein K6C13_16575 [Oscillospiraceae bacterium]|nr:hypothetical protein [Oscillospiraceae bacterium]
MNIFQTLSFLAISTKTRTIIIAADALIAAFAIVFAAKKYLLPMYSNDRLRFLSIIYWLITGAGVLTCIIGIGFNAAVIIGLALILVGIVLLINHSGIKSQRKYLNDVEKMRDKERDISSDSEETAKLFFKDRVEHECARKAELLQGQMGILTMNDNILWENKEKQSLKGNMQFIENLKDRIMGDSEGYARNTSPASADKTAYTAISTPASGKTEEKAPDETVSKLVSEPVSEPASKPVELKKEASENTSAEEDKKKEDIYNTVQAIIKKSDDDSADWRSAAAVSAAYSLIMGTPDREEPAEPPQKQKKAAPVSADNNIAGNSFSEKTAPASTVNTIPADDPSAWRSSEATSAAYNTIMNAKTTDHSGVDKPSWTRLSDSAMDAIQNDIALLKRMPQYIPENAFGDKNDFDLLVPHIAVKFNSSDIKMTGSTAVHATFSNSYDKNIAGTINVTLRSKLDGSMITVPVNIPGEVGVFGGRSVNATNYYVSKTITEYICVKYEWVSVWTIDTSRVTDEEIKNKLDTLRENQHKI